MPGVFLLVAVAVGGPLVGYGIGRWSALWVPAVLCVVLAALILYDGSRYGDTGDDFSGLGAFIVMAVVLPVWLLTTAAGVWLSKRRRHTHL